MAETSARPFAGRTGSVARSCDTPKIEHAPHRQFSRSARPLGAAKLYTDITPLADRVVAKIREVRRARGCGTVVFGDQAGLVFALSEQSVACGNLLAEHPEWLVGVYAGTRGNGAQSGYPSSEDILEDLREHFVRPGVVTAADIYEHIRMQEG
ncbi:hypothetical protein [Xanthomonas campestris]|uniref:hypothetical protein n=1 Tax=Xanthomonas campestris TaxID=339 RepID=UPI0012903F2C|nr:hypothetical protein [Xanthomonas campestris]